MLWNGTLPVSASDTAFERPQIMMPNFYRTLGVLVLLACPLPLMAQGTQADFDRAAGLGARFAGKVSRDRVEPTWFENNTKLWYRNDLQKGEERVRNRGRCEGNT